MADDGSSAFVARQPGGAEAAIAAQALSECPVGAIGNDA
jgi:ferredoxin